MALVTQVDWADRQSGDCGCLHGHGVVSDPIAEGEKLAGEIGPDGKVYTHCFVIANDRVLEAIFPKISLSPWDVYDGQETAVFRINVDQALKQSSVLEIVTEYVGKGYDVTGAALGMAGLEILRALHLPAENNIFADRHKEWCSELNSKYVAKLIPDNADPSTVDPQQFYNFMRSLT